MKINKRIIFFVGILITVGLFRYFNIGQYLTLEMFQEYKQVLKDFVRNHYNLSVLTFCATYIAAVCLSFPAALLTFSGGFLFGFLPGLAYVVISASAGACLIFLIVRYFFGHDLQKKYADKLVNFNKEIDENGAYYLMSLRLSIIVPFFLVNTLSGLTNVSLRAFALTTFIGIIPASAVFAYAGDQLQEVVSFYEIFTPQILLAFLVLTLLSLVPVLKNRHTRK